MFVFKMFSIFFFLSSAYKNCCAGTEAHFPVVYAHTCTNMCGLHLITASAIAKTCLREAVQHFANI